MAISLVLLKQYSKHKLYVRYQQTSVIRYREIDFIFDYLDLIFETEMFKNFSDV